MPATPRWRHSKVINANYVDNVVVKTYTSLCDNAEKLYKNIINIKS